MVFKIIKPLDDNVKEAIISNDIEKLKNINGFDYNQAIMYACTNKKLLTVNYLLNKVTNYNEVAKYAAINGWLSIVRLMIKKGARNYREIIRYATEYEHMDVVDYVLKIQR